MTDNDKTLYFTINDHAIDVAVAEGNPRPIAGPMWFAANVYDGQETYDASMSQFTDAQKMLHAICWYEEQVSTSGHELFYESPSYIVWEIARAGFLTFGLPKAASILSKSADLLGGSIPNDQNEREAIIEHLGVGAFDEFDSTVWHSRQEFRSVIASYVGRNRTDFYFEGTVEFPKYK